MEPTLCPSVQEHCPWFARIPCAARWTAIMLSNMVNLVLDTNVFVAVMRLSGGASREVIRRALVGRYTPYVWECAMVKI